ncbi:MAG: DUF960 domain-containing protein [Streptococcaceae bacterium]|jgi:hypothetical protein|nr:DUF960 domain-containing protein [Streptococcaceae bacterium]
MSFTNTQARFATIGTTTTIPGEIIDTFWYMIDEYLKGVFPLDAIIRFELLDNDGRLSIRYSQTSSPATLTADFQFSFDENWPLEFLAVDDRGAETIMTPEEFGE